MEAWGRFGEVALWLSIGSFRLFPGAVRVLLSEIFSKYRCETSAAGYCWPFASAPFNGFGGCLRPTAAFCLRLPTAAYALLGCAVVLIVGSTMGDGEVHWILGVHLVPVASTHVILYQLAGPCLARAGCLSEHVSVCAFVVETPSEGVGATPSECHLYEHRGRQEGPEGPEGPEGAEGAEGTVRKTTDQAPQNASDCTTKSRKSTRERSKVTLQTTAKQEISKAW